MCIWLLLKTRFSYFQLPLESHRLTAQLWARSWQAILENALRLRLWQFAIGAWIRSRQTSTPPHTQVWGYQVRCKFCSQGIHDHRLLVTSWSTHLCSQLEIHGQGKLVYLGMWIKWQHINPQRDNHRDLLSNPFIFKFNMFSAGCASDRATAQYVTLRIADLRARARSSACSLLAFCCCRSYVNWDVVTFWPQLFYRVGQLLVINT